MEKKFFHIYVIQVCQLDFLPPLLPPDTSNPGTGWPLFCDQDQLVLPNLIQQTKTNGNWHVTLNPCYINFSVFVPSFYSTVKTCLVNKRLVVKDTRKRKAFLKLLQTFDGIHTSIATYSCTLLE